MKRHSKRVAVIVGMKQRTTYRIYTIVGGPHFTKYEIPNGAGRGLTENRKRSHIIAPAMLLGEVIIASGVISASELIGTSLTRQSETTTLWRTFHLILTIVPMEMGCFISLGTSQPMAGISLH